MKPFLVDRHYWFVFRKEIFLLAANDKTPKTETAEEKQASPILIQMGIFAAILFVSSLISPLFPATFPVPTPVIGLVILYILLATHIVKLRKRRKILGLHDQFDCLSIRTIWYRISC